MTGGAEEVRRDREQANDARATSRSAQAAMQQGTGSSGSNRAAPNHLIDTMPHIDSSDMKN
eukprot:2684484-Pyramimonas_sp.AAC.1